MVPEINPNGLAITKNLLTQANAALAPLMPIFNIIDAVLAIKAFAESIPDALGPPPDPSVIAAALAELVEKVAKLAALIPQLAVPYMIVDVLDAIITALNGTITNLEIVIVQEARIAAAMLKASEPGNDALLEVVICADSINASVKGGISEGLGPLNSLFGVLNLFLGLIGLPEIPSMDALPEDSAEAIESLRVTVKLLEDLRASIPLP
jgi:hypothetical protein